MEYRKRVKMLCQWWGEKFDRNPSVASINAIASLSIPTDKLLAECNRAVAGMPGLHSERMLYRLLQDRECSLFKGPSGRRQGGFSKLADCLLAESA